MPERLIYALHL